MATVLILGQVQYLGKRSPSSMTLTVLGPSARRRRARPAVPFFSCLGKWSATGPTITPPAPNYVLWHINVLIRVLGLVPSSHFHEDGGGVVVRRGTVLWR